jgi:uncharacterized membrane protein (UPF0127 family)
VARSRTSRIWLIAAAVIFVLLIGASAVVIPRATGSNAQGSGNARPAWLASKQEPYAEVHVGDTVVWARLAISAEERTRGLSGTEKLEPNEGMLFVYNNRSRHAFWMRGMLFPLDMLWIDTDHVADLKTDLPNPPPGASEANLPIYSPNADANYVLEVNAGWAATNNITIGAPVRVILPEGIQLPQ